MKVTMEMTLDGLVKALRMTAHDLAEDAEAGYVRREAEPGGFVLRQARSEGDDDVEIFRGVRRPRRMFDGPTGQDEDLGE